MNRSEFEDWERRVQARADQLWTAQGSPSGSRDSFIEEARELIALEEVPPATRDPEDTAEPVVEEASLMRNLGEFPTLVDQGEEQTYPDDDVRASDGDASDDGGVLPAEDDAETDRHAVERAVAALSSPETETDADR